MITLFLESPFHPKTIDRVGWKKIENGVGTDKDETREKCTFLLIPIYGTLL
jgi:hypothetical protein